MKDDKKDPDRLTSDDLGDNEDLVLDEGITMRNSTTTVRRHTRSHVGGID
jgi:hypothetical protein